MTSIDRRNALASLGLLGGTSLLGGYVGRVSGQSAASPPKWAYMKLDPHAVADHAYEMYADGGCMYAIVGSVMHALAAKAGEPFRSFPYAMMRYGNAGVGGWGSLCGIVNGCAALIGLFQDEKERKRRDELLSEICVWYELTPLPVYKPNKPAWADEVASSAAGSLLCHVAVSNWCRDAGRDVMSGERRERCRRATVDGVIRVVELLNRNLEDPHCACLGITPEVQACIDCHGPKKLDDAMGKMNCVSCHGFEGEHP